MPDLLKLITFLVRQSRSIRFSRLSVSLVIVTGVISGLLSASFIPFINSLLSDVVKRQSSTSMVVFAGLCISLPVFRLLSGYLVLRLTERALLDLRMQLCRNILAAPLRQLEKLGIHRLLASLTDDVNAIVSAISGLPFLLMQSAMVLFCGYYLWWLSLRLSLYTIAFLVVGVITYQLVVVRANRYLQLQREKWDEMFEGFRALTQGIKELKLHFGRRQQFLDERLQTAAEGRMRYSIIANTIFVAASSWGQVLSFGLLGLLLFSSSYSNVEDPTVLTGYVLTILFILGPIEVLLNLIPMLARAGVAVGKLDQLGVSLSEMPGDTSGVLPESSQRVEGRIELADLTHTYHREAEDGGQDDIFSLGPIDLQLEAGQIIFLVGGNGSGKTTLAMLLLGLYLPDGGEIRVDGVPVDDSNREAYRQLFSVVFSDFYLFDTLFGLDSQGLDERALGYLRALHLERKVKVEDGRLSTLSLSQGQRKRLALLTAYLEDRQIYLFDEWAADQDPQFKRLFYEQLLPELKERGKTVLVISHDDHYYGVADRLIKLADGRLMEDLQQPGSAPASIPDLIEKG